MAAPFFSFVIPVFNRPNEISELLTSMLNLSGETTFEVVVVEDGSSETSEAVINSFHKQLNITYLIKSNTGPGDSRNYGMMRAKGDYFIILDSDVILPKQYLREVEIGLKENHADCFGGPDAAHSSFSKLQKAINFAMTSILTTGGIRGGVLSKRTFQPRSFNMGLSRIAFEASGGFGRIHPGEDPDLVMRLLKLGFKTVLFSKAFVYHKRRVSWSKFYTQVNRFGKVRPILNLRHPESKRLTYWFPSCYLLGVVFSFVMIAFGYWWFLALLGVYQFLLFVVALIRNSSFSIGAMAVVAANIQFYGYGFGFLFSTVKLALSSKAPEELFPDRFFKLLP